ncbi:MAG: hypothetical protein MUO63_20770 [Desulfobulbaceae bacterium]|nr:hypothetical protein [Desulfobulbaceae bacterium]
MKAKPLPYDMGNSGDLIKHGMIAEFTQWWLLHNRTPFIFYDPFGGRPWVEPCKEVTERLLRLKNCALGAAQPEPNTRYYGSGHIIKKIAHYAGGSSQVFISDCNKHAVDDLIESGLDRITLEDFISEDAYSILDCNLTSNSANLLLLDPFADFLENYEKLFPKLTTFVAQAEVAVALFVLSHDSLSFAYEKFNDLRKRDSNERIIQLSFSCPKLQHTGIKGEEKYCSDIILFLPAKYRIPQLEVLRKNLKKYSDKLGRILGQEISYAELI